jgi:sulfate transport system ATP-binding protein
VADRVVIMNQGVIEQIGSPYEVFHEPKTAFVMDFIGASNRFQNWLTKPDRPSAGRTGAAKPVAGKPGGVAKPGGGKPEGVSASDAPSASEYYVRPHEIVIHHHPLWKLLPWKALVRATVQSVREAGATVKVELEDQYGRPVNAELTHKAFNAARVKVGQTVYLEFKKFRRFVGRSGG